MGFNFKKYKGAVTGDSPLHKGEKGEGSGKSITRKQHAGDVGRRATATKAQDRSGYSRSGGDYINVHSFTANTRLSPSLANTLGPSMSPAVRGMGNLGSGGSSKEFELPDINTTLENLRVTTEITPSNTKKYKTEDQVCHPDYLAKHGKGGPGSPECDNYNKYRKKNPKKKDNTVTTKLIDESTGQVIFEYEGEGSDTHQIKDILEKNK